MNTRLLLKNVFLRQRKVFKIEKRINITETCMTVEISIMNKMAVALAADSAATKLFVEGGQIKEKVFSANKIFAMSKHHPIGIMIFGNADFMEIPWETIIKLYRDKLKETKYNTIEEYAKDFINFLQSKKELYPKEQQKKFFRKTIYRHFYRIKNKIEKEIYSLAEVNEFEKERIKEKIKEITSEIVDEYFNLLKKEDKLSGIPKNLGKRLKSKYGDIIEEYKQEIFPEEFLTKTISEQLSESAILLFEKFHFTSEEISGIVITGFGTEDIFPSIQTYHLGGVVEDILIYKFSEDESGSIAFENGSGILAFAQKDMVITFMEGVDPNYNRVIEEDIYLLCTEYPEIIIDSIKKLNKHEKEEQKEKFKEKAKINFENSINKLDSYRREKFVDPILDIVAILPKDELAVMAEALVHLTVLRRRISLESETVGEPIDVAVISKKDGFVWIKRKHYFESELNPPFFMRYNKYKKGGKK